MAVRPISFVLLIASILIIGGEPNFGAESGHCIRFLDQTVAGLLQYKLLPFAR